MTSTLSPPRFHFHCTDRSGRSAAATVSTSYDRSIARWIWHASFRNAGTAAEQLLGTSHALDEVRRDVCHRIEQLLFADRPAVAPQNKGEIRPSRTCVLEGSFEYPNGRPGRYRAERKSDGTIWTVEIVTDEGECFDSIEMPVKQSLTGSGTERDALSVIAKLLVDTYGARVVA